MSVAIAAGGWALAALVALLAERRLAAARELAARAAHEVRGPLTAAGMALHLMARREEAPPERLAALEEQLERARLALEDLGAGRRGRSACDRVARMPVGSLLTELECAWAPAFVACGRTLSVGTAPAGLSVLADRARLAQAVGNLIANALEHGRGRVELRPRVTGGRLRLEVHDEGGGLDRPLDPIVRGPRRGRGRRGRGLAITAGIAERHGGRLTTAPAAGGAVLALELPLHCATPAAAAEVAT